MGHGARGRKYRAEGQKLLAGKDLLLNGLKRSVKLAQYSLMIQEIRKSISKIKLQRNECH
jgi:hypothetical protein